MSTPVLIEMACESHFKDGTVVQSVDARRNGLCYRTGTTGQWKSASGLSFGTLPRNSENIGHALGLGEPLRQVFVMPQA